MSNGLEKEIKIGFLNEQSSAWFGGLNYCKNLFIAISKIDDIKLTPYIFQPQDEKAKFLLKWAKVMKPSFKKDIGYYFQKFVKGKHFNELEYFYSKIPIDIISHSDLMLKNKHIISWIPDFQHIHLPQMFTQEDIERRNQDFLNKATFSDIMIFSSNDALKDFKKFVPYYADKGRVLHFVAILEDNVYEKTDAIKDEVIKKFNLPEKYFYVPNQFWKHKNHKVVFDALAILKSDIKIVFSGNTNDYRHKEYFEDLMNYAKNKGIEKNIINLGIIDLLEVYYLMRNSISIINPSFFEGWSSTVEEAKSLGKNIILSNINVHKEQNPPNAIYFDPHSAKELAEILKNKWENGISSPDFDLEKTAQENIQKRILNFGQEYKEIVLEALSR